MAQMADPRLIEISPVTRVEGHGKVTIHLDGDNRVDEARLHIVEFRGFERFIRGRLMWEVPVIVQRLCGICPVSHHLCRRQGDGPDRGGRRMPPTAEKMRRLMHYGQVMQSHVLHFFPPRRARSAVRIRRPGLSKTQYLRGLKENPELGRRAILMRKFGQEIIEATAGKKVHGTGAIPGGINRNLPIATRDRFLKQIDEMEDWAMDALALARGYILDHLEMVGDFADFPSPYMSLVRASADGALDLYDGTARAHRQGRHVIFDRWIPCEDYHDPASRTCARGPT
jgi:NAD-reducing hydrogenase large subunit